MRQIAAIVLALAAAACVPAEPAGAPAVPVARASVKLPDDVVRFGMDYGLATYIIRECGRSFRFNAAYDRAVTAALEKKYGTNPSWAGSDIRAGIDERKLQDTAFDYIKSRNILVTNRETWCAAGRAEIAEGTGIGKFLVAR